MDIQRELDDFMAAVARLRGLTNYINGLADQAANIAGPQGFAANEVAVRPTPYDNGGVLPGAVKQMTPEEAAAWGAPTAPAPQTPQGPAPSSAPTTDVPPSGAVEVESQEAVPAAPAPDPAATSPAEEAPKKKGGRRTLEEIAADAGVSLDDVRKWQGPGKKVTKSVIDEYASLAVANAVGETPEQAAVGGVSTPPDGSHLPQQASPPFGGAAATPPVAAPSPDGQGAPQEWPVAQPVAAAPGAQFSDWGEAAEYQAQNAAAESVAADEAAQQWKPF